MVKDNDEKTGELDASTRATSVESEIGTVHLQSSHPRKQPKTHSYLNPSTTRSTTEPTTPPYDRPISFSIALSYSRIQQAIRRGDPGAAVTVYPPHAITITPPLPEQPQNPESSVLGKEE